MIFLSSRNKKLFEQISYYLQSCHTALDSFKSTTQYFFKHGVDAHFESLMEKLNKEESDADDGLVHIRKTLYKRSLLPEAREDIIVMLEKTDDIVDEVLHIIQYMFSHNLSVPENLQPDFKELIKTSVKCANKLLRVVIDFLENKQDLIEEIRVVNNLESVCDSQQLKLTKQVFESKVKDFDKILLRDFINALGNISDLSEDAGDILILMQIKRVL